MLFITLVVVVVLGQEDNSPIWFVAALAAAATIAAIVALTYFGTNGYNLRGQVTSSPTREPRAASFGASTMPVG